MGRREEGSNTAESHLDASVPLPLDSLPGWPCPAPGAQGPPAIAWLQVSQGLTFARLQGEARADPHAGEREGLPGSHQSRGAGLSFPWTETGPVDTHPCGRCLTKCLKGKKSHFLSFFFPFYFLIIFLDDFISKKGVGREGGQREGGRTWAPRGAGRVGSRGERGVWGLGFQGRAEACSPRDLGARLVLSTGACSPGYEHPTGELHSHRALGGGQLSSSRLSREGPPGSFSLGHNYLPRGRGEVS